jgi:hypothetical protein
MPQPAPRNPAAPNAPALQPQSEAPQRPESAPTKATLLDVPAPAAVATPMPPASSTSESPAPASISIDEATSSARLIVGPEIKLKGAEITDCDTLIVEGEVDASMDSRVVEIAKQGIFRGKVVVDIAEVRGRFEGELRTSAW